MNQGVKLGAARINRRGKDHRMAKIKEEKLNWKKKENEKEKMPA